MTLKIKNPTQPKTKMQIPEQTVPLPKTKDPTPLRFKRSLPEIKVSVNQTLSDLPFSGKEVQNLLKV